MTDLMTASLSHTSIFNGVTTDLWQQVQPRLQQSGIYQKIVACFQQSEPPHPQHHHLDGNPALIQSLLDQMAQTVIDLVSEVTQSSTPFGSQFDMDVPVSTTDVETDDDDITLLLGQPDAQPATVDGHEMETAIADSLSPTSSPITKLKNSLHWSAKPSAAELQLQRQQARDTRLLEIMELLRQTREQKGISLTQIHQSTHVTVHQLKILESGDLERFPEDIYLRGFIRRIGNVLGLNGMALASSIPSLDDVEEHTVRPSWQVGAHAPSSSGSMQFQSAHLYVAYAALMAGAAGGLNMMMNASQPTATELPPLEPLTESTESTDDLSYLNPDGLKSFQEVAPPEVMPY